MMALLETARISRSAKEKPVLVWFIIVVEFGS
jgi:hypothetical protein